MPLVLGLAAVLMGVSAPRPALARAERGAAGGIWREHVAPSGPPPQRVVTYTVGSRGAVASDLDEFAAHVAATLVDPRGWSLGGTVRWMRIGDAALADLHVVLASADAVAASAPGCSATWSCQPQGTNDVLVNDVRWREMTPSFRRAGRTLDEYRHYVVLHEVGHAPPLDFVHRRCEDTYDPPDGRPAPVMEQQSIAAALGACRTRVWPLPVELAAARRRLLGPDGA
jgi:hypothetical protein